MSDNNTNYTYTGPTDGGNPSGKSKSPAKGGWWKILLAVLCLAYIVSPVDAIPDVFLGLGQIDDLGALVGMVTSVIAAIKGFKAGRASADDDNLNDVDAN